MAINSDIKYLPEGRTSATTGMSLPIRTKSSKVKVTPAVCAIAIKCSTPLVDPPKAISTLMEFSNAALVIISRGLMSKRNKFITASPARRQSIFFSLETASCADDPGKLIPKASIAEAIELAVYMPPQEPGPGKATSSMCLT